MRVLCVAEKPSIAKSITAILAGGQSTSRQSGHQYIRNYDFSYNLPPPLGRPGDADFTVTAVLGHLTSSDFGEDHRRWGSCDPFELFDAPINTFVSADLKKVERNLQAEARNADLLMIWTDCDREGEHIGSEVAAVCRRVKRGIVVKRARFSAIIPAQIHRACRQANDLDMRQANAVEARIALDLRIGAAFTRFTTLGLQNRVGGLAEKQVVSYGPCQFPTLGFVVDQYSRVQAFIPEPFWYIFVSIERQDDADDAGELQTVEFKWRRNHLFGFEEAVILYERCVSELLAIVTKVETKPTTKWKPLPLTTVELQVSGSRLLRMSPKRVLDLAEKLYQKGCLSYPRTETDQYDKDFDFNSLIQKQTYDNDWGVFSQTLLDGEFQRPRNGKKNDKAHPPIHPTAHAGNLDADERRVFELVTRRFLASCHKNAEGKTTSVEIDINGESFSTSGLIVTRWNYLEVYPYDKWTSSALPDFDEEEQFVPSVCELRDGETSRPNLLTEADLVGLMDKNGIGTDATIAEHIAKIIERQYVIEKQEQKVKYLLPSLLGIGLVEGFNRVGLDRSLSKPQLRAETEYSMEKICEGAMEKADVLATTIEQYKEVYVTVRREFDIVMESVNDYMNGEGEIQDALRNAARGRGVARGTARGRGSRVGRGGRGGRGGTAGALARGNHNDNDDDDSDDDADDDDDDDGQDRPPHGGARASRGRGTTRGGTRGAAGGSARGAAGRRARNSPTAPAPKHRRPNEEDNEASTDRMCSCDIPAVQRTVMKSDSPHVGRQFWTCSKTRDEQCGYFEWDDFDAQPQAGPSRPASRQTAGPALKRSRAMVQSTRDNDGDDAIRCECGLEAVTRTTTKVGANQGRSFWTCPNNPKARCGYFQWDDELDAGGSPRPTSGPGPGGSGRGGGPSGGRSQGECFNCGQTGHWSTSCPNGKSDGGGGGTRSSYGKGKSKSKAGGRGGGEGGKDECYNCGKKGHWSNDCPNPARAR